MSNCLKNDINAMQGHGLGTIIATATDHFVILSEDLGFHIPYHPDLRSILLNFLEESLPIMGLGIPFAGKSRLPYNEDKLISSWENLFSNLSEIDAEEAICKWILLVENTDKIFRNRIPTNRWKWLLLDFARDKAHVSDIPIPADKIKDAKICLLQYRLDLLEFRFRDVMDEENYDDWETYLIAERSAESWLTNRMWLYKNLKLWKMLLVDMLTIEEVAELDKWGHEKIASMYDIDDYFSLVELRDDLLTHDYFLSTD